MPCLCALARGTGIEQLTTAFRSECAGFTRAVRLQAPILTYADDFSLQLRISGEAAGIPTSEQPAEADVRAGFEKATEVLWKVIEKKMNTGYTDSVFCELPSVLDGVALFRTLSLSNLVPEESLAVVEDCRAWAVTGRHLMKKEKVNVNRAMVSLVPCRFPCYGS